VNINRVTLIKPLIEDSVYMKDASGTDAELALVTHKPRAASAYAVGHTRCAGESCTLIDAGRFLLLARYVPNVAKRSI